MNELEKLIREQFEMIGKEEILSAFNEQFEYRSLSKEEKEKDWNLLQKSFHSGIAEPKNLAFAAGTGTVLTAIRGESIGIPAISIDFNKVYDGYRVNIRSNIPIRLKMVFVKDQSVLHESVIANEIPNYIVKEKDIEGWTHIYFERM